MSHTKTYENAGYNSMLIALEEVGISAIADKTMGGKMSVAITTSKLFYCSD